MNDDLKKALCAAIQVINLPPQAIERIDTLLDREFMQETLIRAQMMTLDRYLELIVNLTMGIDLENVKKGFDEKDTERIENLQKAAFSLTENLHDSTHIN